MSWKPTQMLRVAEVLRTSTKPLRIETDAGHALAKYCGNPQGRDALASEFVAAELMLIVGIEAPPHAVMKLQLFQMLDYGVDVEEGPAFLTRWEPTAMTFSGSSDVLHQISNPELITEILVFDTWIKNTDRFVTLSGGGSENLDNLLFVPHGAKLKMMAIDHSHAFTETTFDDGFSAEWWDDQEISGTLPNFEEFVTEESLYQVLDSIKSVSAEQLENIVDRLPVQWGFTDNISQNLIDGLISRADAMSEWLPRELLKQSPLSFELGKRK